MRVSVPGLKKSTGMSEFLPLVPGDYTLEVVSCEVKEPKQPQPRDDWHFKFKILEGPNQANGKPAKSYYHMIFIKRPEHPDYNEEKTFAIDELKSMIIAAGVSIKGDEVNPESFVSTKLVASITQEPDYADNTKIRNRVKAWKSA